MIYRLKQLFGLLHEQIHNSLASFCNTGVLWEKFWYYYL